MLLYLWNPSGARLADGAATGTIENTDVMPAAWLARFGRTVAEQVVDSVQARLGGARRPGAEATLAWQRIGLGDGSGDGPGNGASGEAAVEDEAQARLESLTRWLRDEDDAERRRALGSRTVTARELLTGSSFALAAGTEAGGIAGLWGRGAVSRFSGRAGEVSLDGEVAAGMLGADWTRGPWTAGLLLSHARGEGSYRGADKGTVESDLTGVYPYGRHALSERVTLWGVAGYGAGSLTLTPEGQPAIETGIDLVMAAAGLRGVLVRARADRRPAGCRAHRLGHALGIPRAGGGRGPGGAGPEHLPERRRPARRAGRPAAGPAARDGRPAAHCPGAEQSVLQRRPARPGVLAHPGHRCARGRRRRDLGRRRGPGHRAGAAAASVPQAWRHRGRRPRGRARRGRSRPGDLQGAGGGPWRAHPGRERRCGPGHRGDVHAAGGRGGRRRRRGGLRPGWPARAPGRAGADTRPRGGRRPEDAALRARRACRVGLPARW